MITEHRFIVTLGELQTMSQGRRGRGCVQFNSDRVGVGAVGRCKDLEQHLYYLNEYLMGTGKGIRYDLRKNTIVPINFESGNKDNFKVLK